MPEPPNTSAQTCPSSSKTEIDPLDRYIVPRCFICSQGLKSKKRICESCDRKSAIRPGGTISVSTSIRHMNNEGEQVNIGSVLRNEEDIKPGIESIHPVVKIKIQDEGLDRDKGSNKPMSATANEVGPMMVGSKKEKVRDVIVYLLIEDPENRITILDIEKKEEGEP